MQISEGVIHLGRKHLCDLHNALYHPHPISIKQIFLEPKWALSQ